MRNFNLKFQFSLCIWSFPEPDPDMLEVGNGQLSTEEYRSHFSIWALMKVRKGVECKMSQSLLEIDRNEQYIIIHLCDNC